MKSEGVPVGTPSLFVRLIFFVRVYLYTVYVGSIAREKLQRAAVTVDARALLGRIKSMHVF